jgi:hypothetical protein
MNRISEGKVQSLEQSLISSHLLTLPCPLDVERLGKQLLKDSSSKTTGRKESSKGFKLQKQNPLNPNRTLMPKLKKKSNSQKWRHSAVKT